MLVKKLLQQYRSLRIACVAALKYRARTLNNVTIGATFLAFVLSNNIEITYLVTAGCITLFHNVRCSK